MKKIVTHIVSHETIYITFLLFCLSITAFFYYFSNGSMLLYGDANSRLNIARGILDNLKPGFGQLSNVWLPLPTILMLPFIWNNYLWHSGIAGAIVSMVAYIIGGLYLFKSAKILTGSFFASFFATLIYALNINVLYLQTTAMSEPIFICSLIMCIYCFLMWMRKNNNIYYLIASGVAVTAASLIRYEGWAIMVVSIPLVALYLFIKTRKYKYTEGNTILYATIAVFGFGIWSLYLFQLYGNPFYWKDVYLTPSYTTTATNVPTYTFNLTVLQALWKYFMAIVWMNGIFPVIISLISLPILIITVIKKKSFYFLPLVMQLAIIGFMVYTLQRNTPIDQPNLTIANMLSPQTNAFREFNMRYGLSMLPFIALVSSYLFTIRITLLRLVLVALLTVQVYSYFSPDYSVIYQIPRGNNIEMISSDSVNRTAAVTWMKQHYTGGLIMISAKVHNAEMLELGYTFKTFIHEGTGNYWNIAIHSPQVYATWILMTPGSSDDAVAKSLYNSSILKQDYSLVYINNGMQIYKIKTHPEISVQQK